MLTATRVKALLGLALLVAAFLAGYSVASDRCEARRAAALEQALKARAAAEARANEAAQQYLQAQRQRRIIYRDRIKHVPTYIDSGNCRLNADGLQSVACALDPSHCAAEPDDALPDAADAGRP